MGGRSVLAYLALCALCFLLAVLAVGLLVAPAIVRDLAVSCPVGVGYLGECR